MKIDNNFSIEQYEKFVLKFSLKKVWDSLLTILETKGIDYFNNHIINFYDIGRLYEIGLAVENKYSKKECGKYYTPKDVSRVMAEMLTNNETLTCLCDVGCGCGNLTIEVLKIIKDRSVKEFDKVIKNLYLYDLDCTALKICVCRIKALFKTNINPHIICGDFLSRKSEVPENSFIISNPPYSHIKNISRQWEYRTAISESKDLYIGFMEKILHKSKRAVIVSPQSYIVGNKFSSIRYLLGNNGGGEIYSFDNVPATLFDGRKEGVFNTNTANGVRASILNFYDNLRGYKLTHLIRFKSCERKEVINYDYLKSQLGNRLQDLSLPLKCYKELEKFTYNILDHHKSKINSLVENNPKKCNPEYVLHINSSARYFIVCSKKNLDRNGTFDIFAKNKECYYKLYALLNSSYAYLWWRMLDGGILLPKRLLINIPLPDNFGLNDTSIKYCNNLMKKEKDYLVYKKNANKLQESIKFPNKYRTKLNNLLFNDIDFSIIHNNTEIC